MEVVVRKIHLVDLSQLQKIGISTFSETFAENNTKEDLEKYIGEYSCSKYQKTVKISEVKVNPNNPRLIKDDKFKKLVASIKAFPQMLSLRPIVVNDDMIVLGGNMRLKACKEAGLKEVPVIKASELDVDQQRQFIIKDNVGYGEWDWDMLANEWDAEELVEWGLDIPNFDATVIEAEEDDFAVPDGGIETDIVLGDLFEIGEHRLLCGDSTDSDAVAKVLNGNSIDMVFTDPPYGVSYQSNMRTKSDKFKVIENDNVVLDFNHILEGNSMVAFIGIAASLCAVLILLIFKMSKKIEEKMNDKL